MHGRFISALAIIMLCLLAATAYAQPRTVTATGRYTAGTDDSQKKARAMARANALREITEQAGVEIRSMSTIHNFVLTEDKVDLFARAFVPVKEKASGMDRVGSTFEYWVTLEGIIDPEAIAANVSEVESSAAMLAVINTIENRVAELEMNMDIAFEKLLGYKPSEWEPFDPKTMTPQ